MRRQMKNAIEKGERLIEKYPRRDMKTRDIEEIVSLAREKGSTIEGTLFYAIIMAYEAGIATGHGIVTDKIIKNRDCIEYYNACKALNVPLDTFVKDA